jgi:excisionase family DNA binding protein
MTSVELETLIGQLQAMVRKSNERLLSKAEAARRLGISRTDTLGALISSGAIATVSIGRRTKIPASEVDRICREGIRDSATARFQAKRAERVKPEKAANVEEQRAALRSMRF